MYYNGPQFNLHYIETVDLTSLDRKTVGQMQNGLREAYFGANTQTKDRVSAALRRVNNFLKNTPKQVR
jgi:hypothetical protein